MRELLSELADPLTQEPSSSPLPTPDASLVAAVLAGERDAFDDLVRRYERSARATCYAHLRDWHLARDAAQDGFITAYTNLRLLRRADSFGPWLLTIMKHRAMRMARTHRPGTSLHLVADPISKISHTHVDDALLVAVASLPEHERAVVMLRYFDNQQVSVIAAMTGLELTTVKKQLTRAHARLRKLLATEAQS